MSATSDTSQGPKGSGRSPRIATAAPLILVLGSLLAGLGIRAFYVSRPPASSTRWDHHEYVRWGILMREEGFSALYDHPPRETLMWNAGRGTSEIARHPEHYICNYPPLAGYLLYAQISALAKFDATLASNTPEARAVYAALSILGDLFVAAGCYALVGRLTRRVVPKRSDPSAPDWAPAAAFAAVMLAPPFFLDSARWTQTDSWVLAPAVWMLWAMLGAPPRSLSQSKGRIGGLTSRWYTAGLFWGIALGLKTQGILFAPVWMFALIVGRNRKPILLGMLVAVSVLAISSVPFTARSGATWFRESYVNNLFETYKLTTLKAFNVWYLDLLLCEDTDAGRTRLGLEKDTWGKILLAGAVIGAGVMLAARRPPRPDGLLAFTAATLLAAVMLPTRVHERYIILPMPFLIVLAALRPRMGIALVPFIVVASFQMTVLDWLGLGADSWPKIVEKVERQYEELRTKLPADQFAQLPAPRVQLARVDRPKFDADRAALGREKWEWTLTLAELASAAALFAGLLRAQRSSSSSSSSSASFQRSASS